MDFGILELSLIGAVFIVIYYYLSSDYDFWKKRNVRGPEPSFLFGTFKDVMFNKISFGDYCKKLYDEYPGEPAIGIFARSSPLLIINDPEYIKDVLIKDFSLWADRGMRLHEKVEPLGAHLFSLEPARWRPFRTNLSPVFTSGKLKEMFYLLLECADYFSTFLDKYTEKHQDIECRELTAKFSTDVIGVCAFGLKMNAIDDEDSQFRKMGRSVFSIDKFKQIRIFVQQSLPWLFDRLGFIFYEKELNDFFIGTIKETIDYRKKNNINRHDFVDLLIHLKDNPKKLGDIGELICTL